MKKKIFQNIALVSSTCILLTGILLCLCFYFQLGSVVRTELKNRADAYTDFSRETVQNVLANIKPSDVRITIVTAHGEVTFDNAADEAALESHADRIEIQEAIKSGTGKSSRLSETLGKKTYYYAVWLSDGSVLRLAKTADSIYAIFARNLPVMILIMLGVVTLCYFVSARLSQRMVAPINQIDLEHPTVIYDELAPFIRTITSQRNQIAQNIDILEKRQETINTIMDNMSEGAVLVDHKENLLYINKGAKKLFDLADQEEVKNLHSLFRDLDLITIAKKTINGERVTFTKSIDDRDYHIYASPVIGVGAILLFVDVTEQAKAEKLRREFSANVSHELKTPLTSIAGYAELLTNGVAKEEDRFAFVQKIKAESDRLSQLVEDIMLLSGLDEGQDAATLEDLKLAQIASEVKDRLSQKAEQNKVTLKILSDDSSVRANYSHIHELLFNLIDNAIKYNKPGGTVEIHIRKQDDQTELTVSDTGIGIPKAEQTRIFERFYRVDKSRSKKLGGTGLGLAIVKHICLLYGTKPTLESKEGAGTKISIRF
ncbi:MAG: ATP-binding protein [Clostridium sp.]|jgi:two-component system phosphate regulon sensor histidine kinase PhoR|nr:ATP-binding protein [Clostridium sp.]